MILKKVLLCLLVLFFAGISAYARVNFLDEYHPGTDLTFSRNLWHNSAAFYYENGDDFDAANLNYTGYYGLNPYLEVGVESGFRYLSPDGGDNASGLTDLKAAAKYNLFRKSEIAEQEPIFLGEALISIPSGDSTKSLGAGGVGYGAGVIGGVFLSPFVLSADINLTVYARGNNRKEGNTLGYGFYAQYDVSDELLASAGLKGRNFGDDEINGGVIDNSSEEIYLSAGIEYSIAKNYSFRSNLLIGLTEDSSDLIIYTSLKF